MQRASRLVSLRIASFLSGIGGTDVFARHFHGLRDFAREHAESAQIFAAID
jgi:hypothetical protein